MSFVRYDAGENYRNWDDGDCTVRSICLVSNIPYNEAWELLYKLQGEHKACGFRLGEFLRRSPDQLNVKEYLPFKAVRGLKRMTGETFCKAYPTGRYLLKQAHHVVAVVNGKLIDKWDSSKRCVYGAWRIQ